MKANRRLAFLLLGVLLLATGAMLWPTVRRNRESARIMEQQRIKYESTRALIAELNGEAKPRLSRVQELLSKGASIDGSDSGMALYLAASRDARIVRLLLDKGANVNAKAQVYRGRTALMNAALAGKPNIVRLLLSRGAKVNLKSDEGKTALDMVQFPLTFPNVHNTKELTKVEDFLIDAGAKNYDQVK